MSANKIDPKIVEEYQRLLAADPNSRVFAMLADAYRELGIIEQAENIARRGIAKHPQYPAGYVTLGRILLQKKAVPEAIKTLQMATQLSPDNLLAYQLLGEAFLQNKSPREALKAHKMALFLNPSNTRSLDVIKKLEALSAEEFENDLFEMQPLPEAANRTTAQTADSVDASPGIGAGATAAQFGPRSSNPAAQQSLMLERGLSVVDALIVRQQTLRAHTKLQELQDRFPGHPEILSRLELLAADGEEATPIKPVRAREKAVLDRKIKRLQSILQALAQRRPLEPHLF